jgi:hypothetical protein
LGVWKLAELPEQAVVVADALGVGSDPVGVEQQMRPAGPVVLPGAPGGDGQVGPAVRDCEVAEDAPTRPLRGSHLAVPQFLAPYGEAATDSDADFWRPSTLCMTAAHATGKAGDVFLCHPFMVHTATWPHRGAGPRMIAQPAANAPDGFVLDGSDPSPVARAIMKGLAMAN